MSACSPQAKLVDYDDVEVCIPEIALPPLRPGMEGREDDRP